jgi:hypothetical protein
VNAYLVSPSDNPLILLRVLRDLGGEMLFLGLTKTNQTYRRNVSSARLYGQIFAPAISAFTTSLWIMQEVAQVAE